MAKRVIRLPTGGRGLLEIMSWGRKGIARPNGFSQAEVYQISRTVGRAPEVMVKVTGGGIKSGAVAAHFQYISRNGELDVETDEGRRVTDRQEMKSVLADWHLDLTSGQYRPQKSVRMSRKSKLVHNVVLSMPAPTPANKVLVAAKKLAREEFALKHRYALVLHADQANPHVHMVVKAESETGQRLHIDKAMLREWRERFAELMREQGIAANATSRAVRGHNPGKVPTGIYAAQKYGRSTAMHRRATEIIRELWSAGRFHDPAHERLAETRKSLLAGWAHVADTRWSGRAKQP